MSKRRKTKDWHWQTQLANRQPEKFPSWEQEQAELKAERDEAIKEAWIRQIEAWMMRHALENQPLKGDGNGRYA